MQNFSKCDLINALKCDNRYDYVIIYRWQEGVTI